MATSSPLCQLNGGCMGCCGHDFPSAQKIRDAIGENTVEFRSARPQSEADFRAFRDRRSPMDLREGVCRNLISEDGCTLCPLHPARHQGEDLRINHCDTDYLCKTAKTFAKWDIEKQDAFIKFIQNQNLDNITYSLKMDQGIILKEFCDQEEEKNPSFSVK